MAINIGTNFSYRGQNFLGRRKGLAKTIADLLSRSDIVPEGFEVYCSKNSKWYTYRSDFSSIETGHFKLRIDCELEDSGIQKEVYSIGKTLDQINSKVLPIEFRNVVISISKGKNIYLIGKTIILKIFRELRKDDKKIKADEITAVINGKDDSNNIYPDNYLFKNICFDYKQNGLLNLEFKQAAPLF